MKASPTSKPSAATKRSKLARANKISEPECPYDANNGQAVAAFWETAQVRMPGQRGPQKQATKMAVTVRYNPEVLDFFKQTGSGWQTRMNDVLLAHVLKSKRIM
jgi:uncharacterized protein (DUF4415 family)